MAVEVDAPQGEGWRRVAANPELGIAMALLVVLVALSAFGVVMRYVFNSPLTWTEEISGMILVWMTFVGAVGLARHGLHARVELLHDIFGDRPALRLLDGLLDLISIAFLVCVVIGGWDLVSQLGHEKTPALRLPLWLQVIAIPITSALMALFVAWRLVARTLGWTGQRS